MAGPRLDGTQAGAGRSPLSHVTPLALSRRCCPSSAVCFPIFAVIFLVFKFHSGLHPFLRGLTKDLRTQH